MDLIRLRLIKSNNFESFSSHTMIFSTPGRCNIRFSQTLRDVVIFGKGLLKQCLYNHLWSKLHCLLLSITQLHVYVSRTLETCVLYSLTIWHKLLLGTDSRVKKKKYGSFDNGIKGCSCPITASALKASKSNKVRLCRH